MPFDEKFAQTAVTKVAADLDAARTAYDTAKRRHDESSRELTDALNRLNDHQKKFIEAIKAVQDEAARDSDWKRSAQKTVSV